MFGDRIAQYSVYTPAFRLALLSPTVLCFFLKTFFVIADHTGTSLAFSHVVFGAPSHTLRLYKKKGRCVPISVFLVLYKPATSPCGWKPEWKKRGHSKNNHTYTNTLTYGTSTLLSSYAARHGDGEDWHVLSFVTWLQMCIRQQLKSC